jgi:hypothetical protein
MEGKTQLNMGLRNKSDELDRKQHGKNAAHPCRVLESHGSE